MKHALILAALFLVAAAAYVVGWGSGAVAFVVLGVVLEASAWARIVRLRRKRQARLFEARSSTVP